MADTNVNIRLNAPAGDLGGLKDATQQLDAMQTLLKAQPQWMRNLYTVSQDLGLRQRQQGFLGEADQRTLRNTQAQFQNTMRDIGRTADLYTRQGNARQAASFTAQVEAMRQLAPAMGIEVPGAEMPQETRRPLPPGIVRVPPGTPPPQPPRREVSFQPLRGRRGAENYDEMLDALPPGQEATTGLDRGIARAGGMLQRGARAGLAIGAGVGIYEALVRSMTLYESRARSTLGVGQLLSQNFAEITRNVDEFRDTFLLSAQDILPAMAAMVHATGSVTEPSMESALRFGQAYGVNASAAAAMGGRLNRLTASRFGADPLDVIATLAHSRLGQYVGVRISGMRESTPPTIADIAEQVTRMAQVGGPAADVTPDFLTRMRGFLGNMGERFQDTAPEVYARLSQGIAAPAASHIQALRYRAFQSLGSTVEVDGRGYDTNNILDLQVLAQLAPQHGRLMEAYRTQALADGGPGMTGQVLFNAMFGLQNDPAFARRLFHTARNTHGGFEGMDLPAPRADVEETQEEAFLRISRRRLTAGGLLERREIEREGALEDAGETVSNMRRDTESAIPSFVKSIQDGKPVLDALTESFRDLHAASLGILGLLMAMSSAGLLGQGVGIGFMGAGAVRAFTGSVTDYQLAPAQLPLMVQPGNWATPPRTQSTRLQP